MGSLLALGCLPLDDLSTYSSEWRRESQEVASVLPLDASAPAREVTTDAGSERPDAASDASVPEATPAASDAGPEPDAGGDSPADAGESAALDAGSLDAGAAP